MAHSCGTPYISAKRSSRRNASRTASSDFCEDRSSSVSSHRWDQRFFPRRIHRSTDSSDRGLVQGKRTSSFRSTFRIASDPRRCQAIQFCIGTNSHQCSARTWATIFLPQPGRVPRARCIAASKEDRANSCHKQNNGCEDAAIWLAFNRSRPVGFWILDICLFRRGSLKYAYDSTTSHQVDLYRSFGYASRAQPHSSVSGRIENDCPQRKTYSVQAPFSLYINTFPFQPLLALPDQSIMLLPSVTWHIPLHLDTHNCLLAIRQVPIAYRELLQQVIVNRWYLPWVHRDQFILFVEMSNVFDFPFVVR